MYKLYTAPTPNGWKVAMALEELASSIRGTAYRFTIRRATFKLVLANKSQWTNSSVKDNGKRQHHHF